MDSGNQLLMSYLFHHLYLILSVRDLAVQPSFEEFLKDFFHSRSGFYTHFLKVFTAQGCPDIAEFIEIKVNILYYDRGIGGDCSGD